MARERDPNRDKAYEIWKQHEGNITNREIAHLLSADEKKIAVWKQRDKWNVVQQTKSKKENVVQQNKSRGAPVGNSNAKGNKGNKHASPPKRNSNALKHGFFAKYLPPETREIMESMNERTPADLIWDQIQLQYAAIIRAQKIMFVQDQDDMTRELKKTKESDNASEEEYEIQFAWDKHATFLNAQSRAMGELRSLIKQFNEMAHEDDERRLRVEAMKATIEKTKADISRIKGEEDPTEDDGFIDALKAETEEVWKDDNET